MASLKRSCLRWALAYVVLGLLLSALAYARFPKPQVALGSGFVAAIAIWFSIGYVFGIRNRGAEATMMRLATSGERPADGQKVAIAGTISASFEAIEAPITKRRCIAYEYNALGPTTDSGVAVYDGFRLVPSTIAGPRGAVRILAAPELAFDFETCTRVEQYDNFSEYAANTEFTPQTGLNLKAGIALLRGVLADDDGDIRYDIQRDDHANINALQLKERILASGEQVVAIGRYSAAKNALVPDEDALLYSIKITKGRPEDIVRREGKKGIGESILGCGCLVPVLIAAFLGLALVPLDAIEQMFAAKDPSWTEVRVERWLQHSVRPHLKSMMDEGETAITLEAGEARGKLTANGTTARLTRARARRDGGIVEVSLFADGNERVVARVRPDHTIESLRISGDGAFDLAGAEVETLSFDESLVNGRITALSPGDGPKLRVMFHAHFEETP
jgi:hypothetical protein